MKTICINEGWKFQYESALDSYNQYGLAKYGEASGAAAHFYENSNWEDITLPHDWEITLAKDPGANGFSGGYLKSHYHRFRTEEKCPDGKFEPVGWYRREFVPDPTWEGKNIFLEFEGIFHDAVLWVNGVYIDRHLSGYTPFFADITDHIIQGELNSIAVRADADQPEGWWYEGAGIYRNVYIHIGEPVYFKRYGVSVRTDNTGRLDVRAEVVNSSDRIAEDKVYFDVFDSAGTLRASSSCDFSIQPNAETEVYTCMNISDPHLWDIDDPYLYTLKMRIDKEETEEKIGIRTIGFDPDKGFFLNGRKVKIHGACCHQDFGGVGAALTDNLQYYKIRRLKEMGVNAYRCAHHAPAPALLRACDELGMLVMDETRMFGTGPEALKQLETLVRRDRVHPSVFIWVIGNEEFSIQNKEISRKLGEKVSRILKSMDDSRPITYGGNNGGNDTGINASIEVRGVNYIRNGNPHWLDEYHLKYPDQPIIGTEESSSVSSRGYSVNDLANGMIESSGNVTMPWASTPKGWVKFSENRDFFAGAFMWTGFDYRGEPNPFYYNNISSSFGAIDLCGIEKPAFWYYKAWWTEEPVLKITPHWNYAEGENVKLNIFTNCDKVAVIVNGKEKAHIRVNRYDAPELELPYEAGEITAVGEKDGLRLTDTLYTSGGIRQIIAIPVLIGRDKNDTSIYEIVGTDADRNVCPLADNDVRLHIENGKIVGVGNGDPSSMEPETFRPVEITRLIRTFDHDNALWNVPEKYGNVLKPRRDYLVREESAEGFDDDYRIVAQYDESQDKPHIETYTAVIRDACDYSFIEFERLGGKVSVYLNDEVIGDNALRCRVSVSENRPYRFGCKFRQGENTLKVISERRNGDAPAMSGKVTVGRYADPERHVKLHFGRARVFVRSECPEKVVLSAEMTDETQQRISQAGN